MKMPMSYIKKVYNKYNEQIEKVNTEQDEFFDDVRELKGNKIDNMFDMPNVRTGHANRDDFFNSFIGGTKETSTGGF